MRKRRCLAVMLVVVVLICNTIGCKKTTPNNSEKQTSLENIEDLVENDGKVEGTEKKDVEMLEEEKRNYF